jgi:bisphosphoglycerate-dependent phosphoglycerate mutase
VNRLDSCLHALELNGRNHGAVVGKKRTEWVKRHGKDQVLLWGDDSLTKSTKKLDEMPEAESL